MQAPPPISPTVATPKGHRKRKHSQTVDRTEAQTSNGTQAHAIDTNGAPTVNPIRDDDEEVTTSSQTPTPDEEADANSSTNETRNIEDDDIDEMDEDDKSLFEDILDTAELDPYVPDMDTDGIDKRLASKLRARLLRVGPNQFIMETLSNAAVPARSLGAAFGIHPDLDCDDAMYSRVLSLAIVRAYYKRQKLAQYNTIDDVVHLLKNSANIMVITGAGISTSLGIPDFRSKNTGFYSKLEMLGFSEPEEVFDIEQFDDDPTTFYTLAGDILPDMQKGYSPTHGFIRLLQDKRRLQTNYTQNIDNVEELAGIDPNRLIQCHGSWATATCRVCKEKVKGAEIFDDIRRKQVSYCNKCKRHVAAAKQAAPQKKPKPRFDTNSDDDDDSADDNMPQPGVMKPDITFFGEQLPTDFFTRFTERDVKTVDLVLVIGTSLKVAPVSDMPNYLPHEVPHVYISREPIEHVEFDVQLLGECDHVVFELCRRAGWGLEHEMVPDGFEVKVEGVEEKGWVWRVTPDRAERGGEAIV